MVTKFKVFSYFFLINSGANLQAPILLVFNYLKLFFQCKGKIVTTCFV